jgi:hypothetical protein
MLDDTVGIYRRKSTILQSQFVGIQATNSPVEMTGRFAALLHRTRIYVDGVINFVENEAAESPVSATDFENGPFTRNFPKRLNLEISPKGLRGPFVNSKCRNHYVLHRTLTPRSVTKFKGSLERELRRRSLFPGSKDL